MPCTFIKPKGTQKCKSSLPCLKSCCLRCLILNSCRRKKKKKKALNTCTQNILNYKETIKTAKYRTSKKLAAMLIYIACTHVILGILLPSSTYIIISCLPFFFFFKKKLLLLSSEEVEFARWTVPFSQNFHRIQSQMIL